MRKYALVAGVLVALSAACSGVQEPSPLAPSAAVENATSSASPGGVSALNASPVMVLTTQPAADESTQPYPTIAGGIPLTVAFNLCQSSDPDQNPDDPSAGDTLNWQFHFGDTGEPVFDANGRFNADVGHVCRTEHTYREGTYVAAVSVTDKHLEDQGADVRAMARVTRYLTIQSGAASEPICNTVTTYVGNLDGASNDSVFEVGSHTDLPAQGWTNVSGTGRIWDQVINNGMLASTTQWDNYEVQYDTGVAVDKSTRYKLHVDIGYYADWINGDSSYRLQLGVLNGGAFSSLGTPRTGDSPYVGSNYATQVFGGDNLIFTTGVHPPAGTLAVRWAQTGVIMAAANWSDHFGIDNVTLTATSCAP